MPEAVAREDLVRKIGQLCRSFHIKGWCGPRYMTPEERVAYYAAAANETVEPRWEAWVELPHEMDSRNPVVGRTAEVRAVTHYSDTELDELPLEEIARRLTLAAAGRAAHEVLEWACFEGDQLFDAHGNVEDLKRAVAQVIQYLMSSALD
jgi:hypothetical protein